MVNGWLTGSLHLVIYVGVDDAGVALSCLRRRPVAHNAVKDRPFRCGLGLAGPGVAAAGRADRQRRVGS